MVLFNYALKELTAKIVYYGPGLSGKTTNLKYIHEELPDKSKGRMLSLATETDRTLYFDFLPVEAGVVRGIKTRIQLYTVPGQVFYNATRRMVLKGADGIVFVADSQKSAMAANLQSWESLEENLAAHDLDAKGIPIVLQYNKRDLDDLHTIEEMNDILNKVNAPFYEAIAHEGIGVKDTLQAVSGLVLRKVIAKYGGDESNGSISLGMDAAEEKVELAKPLPFETRSERERPSESAGSDEAMESLTAELDQLISGGEPEDASAAPSPVGETEDVLAQVVAETGKDESMAQTTEQTSESSEPGSPAPATPTALDEINLEGILDEALQTEDDPVPVVEERVENDAFSFPDLLADALGEEANQAEQLLDFAETPREATTGQSAAPVGLAPNPAATTLDVHQGQQVPSPTQVQPAGSAQPVRRDPQPPDGATSAPPVPQPAMPASPASPSSLEPAPHDSRLAELSQTQMFVTETHGAAARLEAERTAAAEAASSSAGVTPSPSKDTSSGESRRVEVPITLQLPSEGEEIELQIVLKLKLCRPKK